MQAASNPTIGDTNALTDRATSSRALIGATIAAVALALVVLLAFSTATKPQPADEMTFAVLALMAALCFWTPLYRWCERQEGGLPFGLSAVMFVIYGLARRAGPVHGLEFRLPIDPEDPIVLSYAAMVVLGGAAITLPFWWRNVSRWTKAVLVGSALVAVLACCIFTFLKGYYPVGSTEIIDPAPLVFLLSQLVEFAALALLCNAACLHPKVRGVVMRALPLVLLALWLRHHSTTAPAEEAE